MSTEMKTGLVLSGGGAVGAYQAGVVKALAECGAQISMVSGVSIGALNGAIIAASPDLSEAAARLEALWKYLGENQVLSVNRSVYFSLLKKLFQAMNLCQIPGRAGVLLTTLLRHISTINGFENPMAQPLLSDGPLTGLMDHYLDTDALSDGLPLYVSLYPTEGECRILSTAFVLNWVPELQKLRFSAYPEPAPRAAERSLTGVSSTAPAVPSP